MQRMVYEFQRTCDNNLSFEAFRQKITSQMQTYSKQKMALDSLLGFENTKLINENKKREEMRIKKEELEAKKKLELEKKQRKEERLKKKKEQEAAAELAAAAACTTGASTAPSTSANEQNTNSTSPVTALPAAAATPANPQQGSQPGVPLAIKDDLLNESISSNSNNTSTNTQNQNNSKNKSSMPLPISLGGGPTDDLDFSVNESNNSSITADKALNSSSTANATAAAAAVDQKAKSKSESATTAEENADAVDGSKKEKSAGKIGEAVMQNEHYQTFREFNKIAGEEIIRVPDTFLPDEQMKVARQQTMNNVIDIDPEYLEYLAIEISNVKSTFELFKKLVETIEKLDACCAESAPGLQTSEGILEFIKDYLLANQIAEEFIASSEETIRSSPFFEDFRTRIVKYMEKLTDMLKKMFANFAKFETQDGATTEDLKLAVTLTLDYPHLANIMQKFASLNLSAILAEIYTGLNSKILSFMLAGAPGESASLLFETITPAAPTNPETEKNVLPTTTTTTIPAIVELKSYRRHETFEEGLQITAQSTQEEIKEFIDVIQNNAVKYYAVLTDIARVISSIPMEKKLEELQDHLENLMEAVMKKNVEAFSKPAVIDALGRFDAAMNDKHADAFFFDMKGMAENLETTNVEEKLREGLLSLKNSMYTQMQALKESQDKDDYEILSELITYHFESIAAKTNEVLDKKKKGGSANKKQCFEIVIMNYQLFTTLLDLFETELEGKTSVHYACLVGIVRKVQNRFQEFLNALTSSTFSDSPLMNKSLATYADLTLLACNLTDQLANFQD